jgi:hypothetical protein
MAQWLGQFSGHTHETKVDDAEDLLRHAVESLCGTAAGPGREERIKAVRRLVDRLYRARVKLAKARLVAATGGQSGASLAVRAEEVAGLERKYRAVSQGGVEAILREFGAHDVTSA